MMTHSVSGNKKIIVNKITKGGIEAGYYKDELEMALETLRNGSLARSKAEFHLGYGSLHHLMALLDVKHEVDRMVAEFSARHDPEGKLEPTIHEII